MTVIQVDGIGVNADSGYAVDCDRVVVIPFSQGVIVNILTKPYAPKKSYTLIETDTKRVAIIDQNGKEIDPYSLPPLGQLS